MSRENGATCGQQHLKRNTWVQNHLKNRTNSKRAPGIQISPKIQTRRIPNPLLKSGRQAASDPYSPIRKSFSRALLMRGFSRALLTRRFSKALLLRRFSRALPVRCFCMRLWEIRPRLSTSFLTWIVCVSPTMSLQHPRLM